MRKFQNFETYTQPDQERPVRTKKARRKERKQHKGLGVFISVVAIVCALIAGLAGYITDWLWFKDLGYTAVFWKELLTKLELGIPVFIVITLLVRFYLRTLKNGYFRKIESHEIPDERKLNKVSWVLAALTGLVSAIVSAKTLWLSYLSAANSTGFSLKDPIFNLDISFYVFKLAFLTKLNNLVIFAVIGIIVVTVIYYTMLVSVRTPDFFEREEEPEFEAEPEPEEPFNPFNPGTFRKKQAPKRKMQINEGNMHMLLSIASGKLTFLGIILYLMVAADFALKQFNLLHAHTGVVYGAGFTDVNITLWIYRAVMLLCGVGAIALAIHMRKKEYRKLLRVPVLILIVFALGTGASILVQNLVVSPDEINKETKYLNNNIEYTRYAYGLDDITVEPYAADNSLTGNVIADNDQTISNIRINDYAPVEQYYNQTQSIRQYYKFNDVDIDRYTINGKLTQTYLSAREIDEEKISDTWINRHIKYTHGYGTAVSQVNAVTASGQPDVVVGNIPPEAESKELEITRPEIYFGELTNDYIIVNTKESEFDYPDGSENKYTKYEGKKGIKLNLFNRVLYAIREGSLKILVSGNITSESKIIYNRNVVERVRKIMPQLSYEDDPYMINVDGKLYWVVDAYTTSAYYPYSEPYSGEIGSTNYIRNSIKVVVDAYEGSVNYYIADKDDPIAKTFKKIYPSLFKDYSEMPENMRSHMRYPNTLFKIQAGVYSKYHMTDAKVFYQKEDMWDIAHQIYGTENVQMEPSYYIFKLPSEDKAEFMNMIPFTPKSKQNMTALMMARNDQENYGKLVVYTFPKNKTVYGPMQIEAQIDQNTEISKEFSLWNDSGSKYSRGDLFVIPIGTSLLYVEPVYLEASNEAIPEVKRVIVAYGDRIAYEKTLGEALSSMFEGNFDGVDSNNTDGSSGVSGGGESLESLARKANSEYEAAVECQRQGDWEGYGKHLDKLESYLKKLAGN